MLSKGELTRINYAIDVMEHIRDVLRDKYGDDCPKEVVLAIYTETMSNERGYRIAVNKKECIKNPDDDVYGNPTNTPDEGAGSKKQEESAQRQTAEEKQSEQSKQTPPKVKGKDPKKMIGKIYVLQKQKKDADEVIAGFVETSGGKSIDDLDWDHAWACIQALNTLEDL